MQKHLVKINLIYINVKDCYQRLSVHLYRLALFCLTFEGDLVTSHFYSVLSSGNFKGLYFSPSWAGFVLFFTIYKGAISRLDHVKLLFYRSKMV